MEAIKSLIDMFNKFFDGSAEIKINGSNLEITINHATLIVSLPEIIGADSMGRSQQS